MFFSARCQPTSRFCAIFDRRFLAFELLKWYLGSFSRYKTMFLLHIRSTKHAEQDYIDTKWLGEKLAFWRESWQFGKNIIIANNSIKKRIQNKKGRYTKFPFSHSKCASWGCRKVKNQDLKKKKKKKKNWKVSIGMPCFGGNDFCFWAAVSYL